MYFLWRLQQNEQRGCHFLVMQLPINSKKKKRSIIPIYSIKKGIWEKADHPKNRQRKNNNIRYHQTRSPSLSFNPFVLPSHSHCYIPRLETAIPFPPSAPSITSLLMEKKPSYPAKKNIEKKFHRIVTHWSAKKNSLSISSRCCGGLGEIDENEGRRFEKKIV